MAKLVFINAETYGGFDWHDSYSTNEFLKNDQGEYAITSTDDKNKDATVLATIAKHMHQSLQEVGFDSQYSDSNGNIIRTVHVGLINIPSVEEIIQHLTNRTIFKCVSSLDDIAEIETEVNPEDYTLNSYYSGGSFYSTHYTAYEIEPEDILYIAIENFHVPTKGVPAVERFYKMPFVELKDAEDALQNMILHEDLCYHGCSKELIIIDKNNIPDNPWYKSNVDVINFLKEHPEADNKDNFRIFAEAHLKTLNEI